MEYLALFAQFYFIKNNFLAFSPRGCLQFFPPTTQHQTRQTSVVWSVPVQNTTYSLTVSQVQPLVKHNIAAGYLMLCYILLSYSISLWWVHSQTLFCNLWILTIIIKPSIAFVCIVLSKVSVIIVMSAGDSNTEIWFLCME